MSWRQFWDVLGLPIQEFRDAWPEVPQARLECRTACLTKKFKRIYAALVRRRLAIETLRHEIASAEKHMGRPASDLQSIRIERSRRRLLKREANYQRLLARIARTKRELARLQNNKHEARSC